MSNNENQSEIMFALTIVAKLLFKYTSAPKIGPFFPSLSAGVLNNDVKLLPFGIQQAARVHGRVDVGKGSEIP